MTDEYLTITGFTDYEIMIAYPHTVRNRITGRVLKPTLRLDGYYQHGLRNDAGVQKTYMLHKIIADLFIPNPHGYSTVDHINRVKTDNHIDNLRWTSQWVNTRNITQKRGVVYTWTDTPPDDIVAVTQYGKHSFDRLHYSRSADKFYTDCMDQYRELVVHANNSGTRYVSMIDTNGKIRAICINRFKRQSNIPV